MSTKWFLFDIDAELSGESSIILAKQSTKKLIRVLKEFIPDTYIHCYRSGSKGYHVVTYLDGPYHRQSIQEFQELIIRLAGLDQLEKCKIEIKPYISDTNKTGQTAKLPLGRNFLNQEYGSNFCCFVDIKSLDVKKKLEYMPGQYKYFLSIKQLDRSTFKACVKEVRVASKKAGITIQKKKLQSASKAIRPTNTRQDNITKFCSGYQITAKGQRHNMTFDLAVKLKTFYHLSVKDTTTVLLDWLDTQEGKYSSSKEEAVRDTLFQAEYVYSRGYEYRGRLVETATLTATDAAFFADIRNENHQIGPMERNAMAILVALLRHAKLFMSNDFYISYSKITELTDVRRNAINPCLRRLETLGKIEIVERVDFKKMIPHANTYKLIYPVDTDEVIEGYALRYDSKIEILDILHHFYNSKQLKNMLTKSLYNSVLESQMTSQQIKR